uniref:Unspecific monooxygenase n=1 Tax=Cavia porcellus TaxID=10141 RepID=A0A286XI53_CAVPO
MELSLLLFLALLLGLLLLLFKGHPKAHGNLPPGPRPLPFLGNILQMNRKGLFKSFLQFREKYGDVFTVHLGPRPAVMLCGAETIREALVDQADSFSGRGMIATIESTFQGYGDLLDPLFFFQCATANIICSIVFGERFDYKDQQFLRLLDLFYQSFALISSLSSQMFELFYSVLKYFPGTHSVIYKNLQEINSFIGRSVEKHRETLDPSNPRDFIDTFLLRMDKEKSNSHTEFHHKNLILTSLSLFFAGTETTSTTLRYGFLFLLKYPHVTERVQKEIEQLIGSHCQPALDDRSKMPYTEAVICEIQRFADLLLIGVPHMVTKDTHFRGFFIPKDTEVYPLLSTALHDPRHFEKPDSFNPDHFLDAKGTLKKNEAFIPFSIGKRICLGEGVARAELFLFFTTILQNFSIASPVAPEDIDLTPKELGIGRVPPTYQISFLPRTIDSREK